MARKRMVDPNFFTSRTMNDLPVVTMLTFAGIWCYADDYGRGEDDETMVHAAVWPRRSTMNAKKVRADLDALAHVGVLCRYEVNGFRLMHVTSWAEHQKISHPAKSKLPPCPTHEPEAWAVFLEDDDQEREKYRDVSRAAPEPLRRTSGRTPRQSSLVEISSDKSKNAERGTSPERPGLGLVSHG